MKKITLILTTTILSLTLNAQDCNGYFPMQKGASFEQTTYNPKGKKQSVSKQTIVSTKSITNGVIASVNALIFDSKGKEIMPLNYNVKCENEKLYIDLKKLIPSQMMSQYEGMEIEMSEGFSVMPNNLKVGDELHDAIIIMKIKAGGTVMMNMAITIHERKIIAKEKRTTPAGTFDCLILTQNSTVKMTGLMPITTNSSSKDWIAKDVGSVRMESYNKNGKLESYTELTNFSK